jgi:hypothetical protein
MVDLRATNTKLACDRRIVAAADSPPRMKPFTQRG